MAEFDLLIDGSHLAHRAEHIFESLFTSSSNPTGISYGFLKTLYSLAERFKHRGARILVFWDSNPVVKKKLFPEYKAHRNRSNFSTYFQQIQELKELLYLLGIGQVEVEFEEADDLISSYCFKNQTSKKMIIYSADKDFLQLVDKQVLVLKPKMGKNSEVIYKPEKVLEEFGLEPKGIIFIKVFTGDSSDNIPGVNRLPKKQLLKILENIPLDGFQTIEKIYNDLDNFDFLTKLQYTRIREFEDQAFKNFELIKLKTHLKVNVTRNYFDSPNLSKSFQEFEFFEFLENFSQWQNLFAEEIR